MFDQTVDISCQTAMKLWTEGARGVVCTHCPAHLKMFPQKIYSLSEWQQMLIYGPNFCVAAVAFYSTIRHATFVIREVVDWGPRAMPPPNNLGFGPYSVLT